MQKKTTEAANTSGDADTEDTDRDNNPSPSKRKYKTLGKRRASERVQVNLRRMTQEELAAATEPDIADDYDDDFFDQTYQPPSEQTSSTGMDISPPVEEGQGHGQGQGLSQSQRVTTAAERQAKLAKRFAPKFSALNATSSSTGGSRTRSPSPIAGPSGNARTKQGTSLIQAGTSKANAGTSNDNPGTSNAKGATSKKASEEDIYLDEEALIQPLQNPVC